jgi:hypothetical protein
LGFFLEKRTEVRRPTSGASTEEEALRSGGGGRGGKGYFFTLILNYGFINVQEFSKRNRV